MPKETINSRYEGRTYPDGTTPHEPRAHIGWGREAEYVQVGVLLHPDGDVEDPHNEKYGYYIQLDRDGINRMIRTLRKARDAAFGADA